MGISNDGNIYGIAWCIYDAKDNFIRRVEHVFPNKLSFEQIEEIKAEYNKLTPVERVFAKIKFYTKCTSTYDPQAGEFMLWIPAPIKRLEQLFLIGDIII
jgi:uncharacterized protein (DUF2344 family)